MASIPEKVFLIVAVTKAEIQAILGVFSVEVTQARKRAEGEKFYYALGVHGQTRIFLVQCEPGNATPGGSLLTVRWAIDHLHPQAVLMCGVAYGLHPEQQKQGEILVAHQILHYDPQITDTRHGQTLNGDRTTTSLLPLFRDADNAWKGVKVHFGLVISSEKQANDQVFRNWLSRAEPTAIGWEMEGAGMYAAARDVKVDWTLVKAIWDQPDQDTPGLRAAVSNAAKFILHTLQLSGTPVIETKQVDIVSRGKFKKIIKLPSFLSLKLLAFVGLSLIIGCGIFIPLFVIPPPPTPTATITPTVTIPPTVTITPIPSLTPTPTPPAECLKAKVASVSLSDAITLTPNPTSKSVTLPDTGWAYLSIKILLVNDAGANITDKCACNWEGTISYKDGTRTTLNGPNKGCGFPLDRPKELKAFEAVMLTVAGKTLLAINYP
jgi:nucleoside phosphorylase